MNLVMKIAVDPMMLRRVSWVAQSRQVSLVSRCPCSYTDIFQIHTHILESCNSLYAGKHRGCNKSSKYSGADESSGSLSLSDSVRSGFDGEQASDSRT